MNAGAFRKLIPLGCVVPLLLAGCGEDEPPRYHVSGTVTFEGEPVPAGSIVFQPDPAAGNAGPYGSATIENGQFDTREAGQAASGGPQIVIIEAFDGMATNPDYAPFGAALGDGYQKRHDLPEADTTLDIELTDK